jgi:hypothetical protein
MKPFYKSRKFLIAVVDAGAGLLSLYVSQFLPTHKDLILQTWAFLQPVVVVWIAAIAYEDGQAMRAGLKE